MTIRNKKKFALRAIVALILVQVVWFSAVQYFINKTQIKTTAEVIRIESLGNTCGTSRYCDQSERTYPVYEYFDTNGKRYEQDDRYLGDFKQNNPLRAIFGKEIGDRVTAYYTREKPQEVLFLSSPFSYAAWLTPLYFAFIICLFVGIMIFLLKLRYAISSIRPH